MLNNPNPLLSKDELCRSCILLRIFNVNQFKMVEAMGLKMIALRSSAMTSLVYQVS
jgi:hypothetical protein